VNEIKHAYSKMIFVWFKNGLLYIYANPLQCIWLKKNSLYSLTNQTCVIRAQKPPLPAKPVKVIPLTEAMNAISASKAEPSK